MLDDDGRALAIRQRTRLGERREGGVATIQPGRDIRQELEHERLVEQIVGPLRPLDRFSDQPIGAFDVALPRADRRLHAAPDLLVVDVVAGAGVTTLGRESASLVEPPEQVAGQRSLPGSGGGMRDVAALEQQRVIRLPVPIGGLEVAGPHLDAPRPLLEPGGSEPSRSSWISVARA